MAYVNELSGSKLRSKMGFGLNEAAAAPTSSFAKKQLEKMGWTEGDGLGKRRQGMSKHIKVKKRADEIGLGHVRTELQEQNQWWNDGMSSVLARLSGGTKKTATDEDLYKATNGKRFGMRAQRKQTGKWARTETFSKEAEADARAKIEWNGQGEAKVILKKENKKKRKSRSKDLNDEGCLAEKDKRRKKNRHSEKDENKEKKRSKKKEKKREKKKKKEEN